MVFRVIRPSGLGRKVPSLRAMTEKKSNLKQIGSQHSVTIATSSESKTSIKIIEYHSKYETNPGWGSGLLALQDRDAVL